MPSDPAITPPLPDAGTASASENPSLARSGDVSKHSLFLALLLYCTVLFHQLHFSTDSVTCPDGYFHARLSTMLPEHGLSRSFPWLQFTALKDKYFDNHFLYNVYLYPFTTSAADPLDGAKYATIVLQLLVIIALYVLLWRWRVPWPVFWTVLFLVGSAYLLSRFMMVRSHILSMALMLAAMHFIMSGRFWACFAIGFAYVWCYSAPLAVVCTALAAELGALILLGKPDRMPKMTLAVSLGFVAGHFIHPYTPYTVDALLAVLKVTSTAAVGGSVELGSEYKPIGVGELFIVSPGVAAAMIAAAAGALALRFGFVPHKKLSRESALALGAAGGWFVSMFIFKRVIEYAAPLSIVAAALVFRDLVGDRQRWSLPTLASESRQRALALGAALALLLVASHVWTYSLLKLHIDTENNANRRYYANTAQWMKKNIPHQSVVVNFYWDEFPELFYQAPEFYYVGGMDPTLMQSAYPAHSAALESMRMRLIPGDEIERADAPLDFERLATLFNSDYLVMRTYRALKYPRLRSGLIAAERNADSILPIHADQGAVVYRLRQP